MTTEKETKKTNNRDIDLVKIQIYSERIHASYTTVMSYAIAFLVGGLIFSFTILYESLFSLSFIGFMLLVFTFIIISAVIMYDVSRDYGRNYKEISKLMEMVKEGKELPPLDEI